MIDTNGRVAVHLGKLIPIVVLSGAVLMGERAEAQVQPQCPITIRDQANPSQCIQASSLPAGGTLLPLGPYFFVSPSGDAGIGTTNPLAKLHVASGGAGGLLVTDGATDVFHVDVPSSTLRMQLAEWNLATPTTAFLPSAAPALNFKAPSGASVFSIDALNRRVGISGGVADVSKPLYPLHVQHNVNDDAGVIVARVLTDVVTPNDSPAWHYGTWSTARVPSGNSNFTGGFVGVAAGAAVSTSGDVSETIGATASSTQGGTGNLENAYGLWGNVSAYDGTIANAHAIAAQVNAENIGTIGNAYGVHVATPTVNGTIDNAYGVYIEPQLASSAAYSLYAAGGTSYFGGDVGIGNALPTARLHVERPATGEVITAKRTDTQQALRIWFHQPTGATTIQASKFSSADDLSINPDGGNVGIGIPSPSNILTVIRGSRTDPIADAWTTYSSRRWKENIAPITEPIETVQKLRGVTFDWKESGEHDVGMIAEEVGEVLPELVQFEEDGQARSIDYARLTSVLVEAVKAQQTQIDELQEQVRELREVKSRD